MDLRRCAAWTSGGLLMVTAGSIAALTSVIAAGCSSGSTPTAVGPIVYSDSATGPYQLYLIRSDGSGQRKLSSQNGASEGTVSPDGKVIAFVTDGLWGVNADGTHERRLTPPGMQAWSPVWSPDGEKILFWSGLPTETADLEVIDIARNRLQSLTRSSAIECCFAWSADGDEIFFAREVPDGWTLHAIEADGTDERHLGHLDGDPAYYIGLDWSPNGERILFERELEDPGNDELPFGNTEIFSADSDGSDVKNLTRNDASDGYATWSPDGAQIAFVSDRSGSDRLWIMDADGANPHSVTKDMDEVATAAWASDGGRIAFAASDPDDEAARTPLWVARIDGTGVSKLTPNGFVWIDEVGWTPRITR